MRKFLAMLVVLALAVSTLGATQNTSLDAMKNKAVELSVGLVGFSYTSCNGCEGIFVARSGGAESGVFSGLGGGVVSMGFFFSPGVSVEPSLAISTLRSGGESVTAYSVGVALPYYVDKGWGRRGAYFAPRAIFTSLSGSTGESAGQFSAGVALGNKMALNDLASLKLQANFDYGFESSDVSSTSSFGALLGLSVFLKGKAR